MQDRIVGVLGYAAVVGGAILFKNDWNVLGVVVLTIGSCALIGAGYGAGSRDRKRP